MNTSFSAFKWTFSLRMGLLSIAVLAAWSIFGIQSRDLLAAFSTYNSKRMVRDTLAQAPMLIKQQQSQMMKLQQAGFWSDSERSTAFAQMDFSSLLSERCAALDLRLVALPYADETNEADEENEGERSSYFSLAGPLLQQLHLLQELESGGRIGRLTEAHFIRQPIRKGSRRRSILLSRIGIAQSLPFSPTP